jgi:hypothetical protein
MPHEQGTAIILGAPLSQVTGKGFTGLRWQGKMLRALALGMVECHDPASPVHAVQRQVGGFVSAQAKID